MTVNELINFLQMIEDKEKPVCYTSDVFRGCDYASITTVKNNNNCVILDCIAYTDYKPRYILENNGNEKTYTF